MSEIQAEDLDWENAEVQDAQELRDAHVFPDNNIATFNIQLLSPETNGDAPRLTETDKRVLTDWPVKLGVIEEELEATLPDGYRVRITEWNK